GFQSVEGGVEQGAAGSALALVAAGIVGAPSVARSARPCALGARVSPRGRPGAVGPWAVRRTAFAGVASRPGIRSRAHRHDPRPVHTRSNTCARQVSLPLPGMHSVTLDL